MTHLDPRDRVLDELGLDDATKALIRASVDAAQPIANDVRAVIRRIWCEATAAIRAERASGLLTTDEVAEELGMKPAGVRRLIRRKELAALRVGKGYRVDPSDLASFKRARRV